MKQSNFTFAEGFLGIQAKKAVQEGNKMKVFDWNKAANIIKEKLKTDKNLIAEAGLQGDWAYTGGVIYTDNKPILDDYTYLASIWATPTLILNEGKDNEEEIECYTEDENSRFNEESKWDEISLNILNSND